MSILLEFSFLKSIFNFVTKIIVLARKYAVTELIVILVFKLRWLQKKFLTIGQKNLLKFESVKIFLERFHFR